MDIYIYIFLNEEASVKLLEQILFQKHKSCLITINYLHNRKIYLVYFFFKKTKIYNSGRLDLIATRQFSSLL